jgi:hypothetical protein
MKRVVVPERPKMKIVVEDIPLPLKIAFWLIVPIWAIANIGVAVASIVGY